MNREEIIRMAREAGAMFDHRTWVERDLTLVSERFFLRHVDLLFVEFLHGFAALVAAAEREAVIAIVNDNSDSDGLCCTDDLLAAIRARGNT